MKWMLSGLGSAFTIGVIFWAGATYNRISGIEGRLGNIEALMAKLSNIGMLEIRVQELERRQEKSELLIQQLR